MNAIAKIKGVEVRLAVRLSRGTFYLEGRKWLGDVSVNVSDHNDNNDCFRRRRMLREKKFFGIFCRGINMKRLIICIMILIMMYFTFISPLVRYSHPERLFTVFDNLFSHIKSLATDAIMRYFNIKSFGNELQKVMTRQAEGQMKVVRDVAIKLSIHPTSTPKADTTTPALTSQLHRSQNLPQLHLRRNGRLAPHHRPSAPSQARRKKSAPF